MEDQLLKGSGGAVLRCPDRELFRMQQQQVGHVISIFCVILGAADDKSLAVFLQGDRVDGMKRDPVVNLKKWNEVTGGLLQTETDAAAGVLQAQLKQPIPERFGRGCDDAVAALAGASVNECEIGFGVGTIQADDQIVGMRSVHQVFWC